MKLYKLILFFGAAVISLSACKKIEYSPKGAVDTEQAVKNEKDVADVLNACYTPLAGDNFMGGKLQRISQLMTDEVNTTVITGFDSDISNFKSSPNDDGIKNIYKEPYVVIQRANKVLENSNLVVSSPAIKSNYEGQAKFMRAFCHFELVRLFAQPYGYTANNTHLGIIIKTSSEFEPGRSRNTVAETYNLIIKDLSEAQSLLPVSNGAYPTSWAAKAMLARVYFQMNMFDSAYKYSNQVVTGSSASFDASAAYAIKRFNSPVSSEAIFYLINEPGGGIQPRFNGLRNNSTPTYNLGALPVASSTYLANASNVADVRKTWYNVQAVTPTILYGVEKYKITNFILPLIHITEMKLIRAESAAETGANLSIAITDINDITTRAYGGTLANLPAGSTAATIKARVRAERRKEMIYENGDRLQEIKRIGAKGEPSFNRGGAPWNCDGMILKFPAVEISIFNGFIQNPSGTCL
jgi:starch-binding outer membrane protein, SusD/RagB family